MRRQRSIRGVAIGAAMLLTAGLLAELAGPPARLGAQTHASPTPGPYAGQQDSPIRGLSEAEIAALRNGAGMGLARPGELNGYPGPLHVLELAAELGLTSEQRSTVQSLREQMLAEAIPLGEQFLDRYAALERAFREGSITPETLREHTSALGRVEGDLRATHLKYHLLTRPLLSDEQVAAYARLRGYADGPAIPEHRPGGHGGSGH